MLIPTKKSASYSSEFKHDFQDGTSKFSLQKNVKSGIEISELAENFKKLAERFPSEEKKNEWGIVTKKISLKNVEVLTRPAEKAVLKTKQFDNAQQLKASQYSHCSASSKIPIPGKELPHLTK